MAKSHNGYLCICKYCGKEFYSWNSLKDVCSSSKCQKIHKRNKRVSDKPNYSINEVIRLAEENGVHYGTMSLFLDEGIRTW